MLQCRTRDNFRPWGHFYPRKRNYKVTVLLKLELSVEISISWKKKNNNNVLQIQMGTFLSKIFYRTRDNFRPWGYFYPTKRNYKVVVLLNLELSQLKYAAKDWVKNESAPYILRCNKQIACTYLCLNTYETKLHATK
jgi:hypothetical protein